MIYYKTSKQIWSRPDNCAAYVIGEEGENILLILNSKKIYIPVHRYVYQVEVTDEVVEGQPDVREQALALVKVELQEMLWERLKSLQYESKVYRGEFPFHDLDGPVTFVVCETDPETLVWTGTGYEGSATFGVAAFCWVSEEFLELEEEAFEILLPDELEVLPSEGPLEQ